jgi:hypothetical protein
MQEARLARYYYMGRRSERKELSRNEESDHPTHMGKGLVTRRNLTFAVRLKSAPAVCRPPRTRRLAEERELTIDTTYGRDGC